MRSVPSWRELRGPCVWGDSLKVSLWFQFALLLGLRSEEEATVDARCVYFRSPDPRPTLRPTSPLGLTQLLCQGPSVVPATCPWVRASWHPRGGGGWRREGCGGPGAEALQGPSLGNPLLTGSPCSPVSRWMWTWQWLDKSKETDVEGTV